MDSIEKLNNIAAQIPAGRVLDVASGAGEFIHFIREFSEVESVTALDPSEMSRKFISEQFPDVDFILGTAEKIPAEDGSFDTVCMSNSLHHLSDIPTALGELLRVLKPGGNLIINEMQRDTDDEVRRNHVRLHHWSSALDRKFGRFHGETFDSAFIKSTIESLSLENLIIIDYEWPIENPHDEKMTSQKIATIEKTIERLSDKPGLDDIFAEGREIVESIKQIGYAPAPSIFLWGIKPKG